MVYCYCTMIEFTFFVRLFQRIERPSLLGLVKSVRCMYSESHYIYCTKPHVFEKSGKSSSKVLEKLRTTIWEKQVTGSNELRTAQCPIYLVKFQRRKVGNHIFSICRNRPLNLNRHATKS